MESPGLRLLEASCTGGQGSWRVVVVDKSTVATVRTSTNVCIYGLFAFRTNRITFHTRKIQANLHTMQDTNMWQKPPYSAIARIYTVDTDTATLIWDHYVLVIHSYIKQIRGVKKKQTYTGKNTPRWCYKNVLYYVTSCFQARWHGRVKRVLGSCQYGCHCTACQNRTQVWLQSDKNIGHLHEDPAT